MSFLSSLGFDKCGLKLPLYQSQFIQANAGVLRLAVVMLQLVLQKHPLLTTPCRCCLLQQGPWPSTGPISLPASFPLYKHTASLLSSHSTTHAATTSAQTAPRSWTLSIAVFRCCWSRSWFDMKGWHWLQKHAFQAFVSGPQYTLTSQG